MSQNFRSRFDEMRNNDFSEAKPKSDLYDRSSTYIGHSYARSICFLLADGRKVIMNYAYFVSAEFEIVDDKNCIKINFASATVTLIGFQLENLFFQLLEHVPRIIEVENDRYMQSNSNLDYVIVEIAIERKESA